MQCHEFEHRLNCLLDDRQSPESDQLLVAHASGCERCGQLLIGQRLLLAGLRHGVASAAGSQLAQNVVAEYQAVPMDARVLDGGAMRRRAWQVLAWLAATAAAFVVAVSIYVASRPGQSNIAVASPEVKGGRNAVKPIEPRKPDHAVAHSDPRSSDGSGRRGVARGAFPLFPRTGYGVTIADMATSSIPEAVERIEEVERFAPGIRPIRVSFAVLWNAIWRSIPGFGAEEQDPKAWHGRVDMRPIV
jgi:hypothetical protein